MDIDITKIFVYLNSFIFIVIVIAVVIFFSLFLKKTLLKKAHTKKMTHNVIMFTNLFSYIAIFLAILFTFISVTGSVNLGITAGLLTAALGWALQRPITGIAGWLMVVITEPFTIGDRIIVGSVKGDVKNMTLTHIHLNEFGGTTTGEETSGRLILIPNSVIFEQNIINYTSQNDYILDEVVFTITYDSNMDLARQIAIKASEKITKDILEKVPKKPFVRVSFQASGVDVRIKYYTTATKRQKTNSEVTEEVFKTITNEKKVRFAYPHTEIIFKNKAISKN
jgi:small-conductance mechanosensitive channel